MGLFKISTCALEGEKLYLGIIFVFGIMFDYMEEVVQQSLFIVFSNIGTLALPPNHNPLSNQFIDCFAQSTDRDLKFFGKVLLGR